MQHRNFGNTNPKNLPKVPDNGSQEIINKLNEENEKLRIELDYYKNATAAAYLSSTEKAIYIDFNENCDFDLIARRRDLTVYDIDKITHTEENTTQQSAD